MGLTERHWFEDEEPELTERQLEDVIDIQDKAYKRGYYKGYSDRDKEIVRCKNCRWRANNGATSTKWLPCMNNRYDDDWFCADGV